LVQLTPWKLQKLVASPAAALLQPAFDTQPVPFVAAYRSPSAPQLAASSSAAHVKAPRTGAAHRQ
jgi:hypothetical protein